MNIAKAPSTQTVRALGPAAPAVATHCRFVPVVTKKRTTSRSPRARFSPAGSGVKPGFSVRAAVDLRARWLNAHSIAAVVWCRPGDAPRMSSGQTPWEAVVVGAGHNGLTAAAYLAAGGPAHARARAARDRGRLLRHRGDPPRLPRVHHVLHREHAASRGDPRAGARLPRAAHGALRSRALRAVPRRRAISPGGPTPAAPLSEMRAHSARDADAFAAIDARLKKLARYLQPFFMEPPPDVHARGLDGLMRGAAGRPPRPGHQRRRDRRDGHVPDRQPGRLPRPALRVREGQDADPREQRLRQARRALPARHRDRPPVPPARQRRPRPSRASTAT